MKNKKGFTLIELLAVLIILAAVTLIVIPSVSKSIEESKKASTIESGNNLINAVEMYMVSSKKGYGSIDVLDSNLNYKGEKPTFGEVTIAKNGKAKMYAYINGYCLTKKYNEEIVAEKTTQEDCTAPTSKTYTNGEVVYFNVTLGTSCTDYKDSNSNTGYNGINPSNGQTSCLKFYAFNDDGGKTVNLILDHNTTAWVAWNSSGSNVNGPTTLLEQLKSDTKAWEGTVTPVNYTMDQSTQGSKANYTIDYSTYKARLITANEIAQITGNTGWDETTANDWYYYDTKTQSESTTCTSGNTTGCLYGWLYDRTNNDCTTYGCLNNSDVEIMGYWTASSLAGDYELAWAVKFDATAANDTVRTSTMEGVRPVIEVSKDSLE